ncbi:D-glycero-beta-D-manno-heptose 1,7-bisphosphate 7-phosphatase [Geobacter sp. FeAm09]|uniref:D-glycero-beta-D-manno-heptose 1,7-bisphosphate 7-phosphatase n=1 Tax=Geobacter sp. FeAm09 TaxID=2597769 RepID=UPI0011EE219E|nr:D-glycero-beta-D-manno-heptose 1,7-bisphosphate 7-phosphatase [Geobacter sp. FeAm09]QEM68110.1 D-glycero-beta-D-manno-heptose 1,7-bisphosphate 7-phosphatase [Geobacter sp. FeAm09]
MVLGDGVGRRAVFVDRDGTINVEKDYLYRIEDFEFIPGAPEAIRLLNEAGFLVVVVTNQSGVARGYYTEEDVESLHRHIDAELAKTGARVDAWRYCPHHPAGRGSYSLPCRCRKPLPGMLLDAARRHTIDLAASVMIGDKLADVEAGIAAGCRTILVRSGYGAAEEARVSPGTTVCDDLLAAVLSLVGQRDEV